MEYKPDLNRQRERRSPNKRSCAVKISYLILMPDSCSSQLITTSGWIFGEWWGAECQHRFNRITENTFFKLTHLLSYVFTII